MAFNLLVLDEILKKIEIGKNNSQGYIFHILEHFTTKLCSFTKFRMLFQDAVIFLPVSYFFKISSKRLKVHFLYRV